MNKLIREDYLSRLRGHYSTEEIKHIKGIRNCGKTTLLKQIIYEIGQTTDSSHIIYLDLETNKDLQDNLFSLLQETGMNYIFLDEFGFNSKAIEIVNLLRQKYLCSVFLCTSYEYNLNQKDIVSFTVLPLSYRESIELLTLNGKKTSSEFFNDYKAWGGFPQRFEITDEKLLPNFFENKYYSLTKKHVFKRENPQEEYKFNTITSLLLGNSGKEFKASFIRDFSNINKTSDRRISERKSIYNYLEKAEKAFLVTSVKRYDISKKAVLISKEKLYATDIAFKVQKSKYLNSGETCTLKNLVFNELMFRGYQVYTGKTYKSEIDFVVFEGNKKCFIQVVSRLTDAKEIAEIFSSFSPIKDASPRYVISLDRFDLSHDGITHINIEDFLLNRKVLTLF